MRRILNFINGVKKKNVEERQHEIKQLDNEKLIMLALARTIYLRFGYCDCDMGLANELTERALDPMKERHAQAI